MNNLNAFLASAVDRRQFLRAGGMAGAALVGGGILAGCGGNSTPSGSGRGGGGNATTDSEVLNFALNLEYLEAEFYLRATTGAGLSSADIGGSPGAVSGGAQVPFATPIIHQLAQTLATDEVNHVRFLRGALGAGAVSRPAIDFAASFPALATAAGLPAGFNPFADEKSFLLGAFVFEDVGVTAYHGGATLLSSTYISPAAGILGTEAYHAGSIRTLIYNAGTNYANDADQIAALRAQLDGTGNDDIGPIVNGSFQCDDVDANSIVFSRTTAQVLKIVYAGGTTSGGFFPNGLNGVIH